MIYEVSTTRAAGTARWTQTTALDGTDYVLAFDWLGRLSRWCLHLRDGDGAAIRTGIILNAGAFLLRGLVDPRRPAGELLVVDRTGRLDADPGFEDLGSRFALVYVDAAELGR